MNAELVILPSPTNIPTKTNSTNRSIVHSTEEIMG